MKKGKIQIGLELFIHLALLLIVIAAFFSVTGLIKNNISHDLRAEAKDYVLTHDAIISYSDNLNYVYNPRENVTIIFDEANCLVEARHKSELTQPVRFFCGTDKSAFTKAERINNKIIIKNEQKRDI
ncbi:hypothetical protein J4230_05670 [Candidatus Woesearchaeota archaeon]|nr:hypothetical protein [Candidatus Woesearchaeota archaeon]